MSKVLVVGFDGATFDIIQPLIAEGRLPTLAHILKTGSSGTLRSSIPPVTPSAWTSVFTGKNAGKHGIYDFQSLDPQTYQFNTVRTDEHREKTLWHLLGEANRRSIVMDVPFTYPPQPLNGLMLTGYGTPRNKAGATFTYPENLAERLPAGLHPQIKVALPTNKFDRSQTFIDEWWDVMDGRQQLLTHLIDHEEWDFFMVVFSITDNMAHVFWTYVDPMHPNYYRPEAENYRNAFLKGYEVCDQLLGELMERAGPDTNTLVLSDHGFGSVRPRQYVYNRLLEGKFLRPKGSPGRGRLIRTAINTYNRFPFLREWVKNLQPNNRRSLIKSLKSQGVMPTDTSIDFARSHVIPSNFGLRMWVNDDERFGQGFVPAGQRQATLDKLSTYLLADHDDITGDPIIANTYQGKDLYHGEFVSRGPDLVIEYANFYRPGNTTTLRNPHLEGGHTLDGIFLAHGPAIGQADVQGASLIDLAPTVLHLLGQPIPPDFDGQVIESALSPSYLDENPIRPGTEPARHHTATTSAGYSEEEDADIQEQLRQLGYIE